MEEESVSQEGSEVEEESTSAEEKTASQGYYDAETPEKCTKVTTLHEEFYEDLTARHAKAKEDFQVYHTRLQELINQQQGKVTEHCSKLGVVWNAVSKS